MRVTIAGEPGAGSTTIAKKLAEKTNYKLITTGEIVKQIAKQQNKTIEQLWQEQDKNPKKEKQFNNKINNQQKKQAKKYKNIIINGKLSAYNNPKAELKILLTADIKTRAQRTAKRDRRTIKKQQQELEKREEEERKNWKKMYGFDYTKNKNKYDMIIDTTNLTPTKITNAIIKQMKKIQEQQEEKRRKKQWQ